MRTVRHPPGRAGRLWLVQRLAGAQRASGILERKHQALERDEQRLSELADRTGAAWEVTVAAAERWLQRAAMLSGRLPLVVVPHQAGGARAHLEWISQMGVEYPATAECEQAPRHPLAGSAAYAPAQEAYARAMEAAVDHAAALCALGRVRAELARTLQRLRAVRDRWIPALQEALGELELHLDEYEREELIRTRRLLGGA